MLQLNPSKIHSIDKTVRTEMDPDAVLYGISYTEHIGINKIDPDGTISLLYELIRLPHDDKNESLAWPYEIKLYDKEAQSNPDVPIHWKQKLIHIDKFVAELCDYFKRGRLHNGAYLRVVNGLHHRALTYKQAKAILRFENRASRNLESKPAAIREIDPTKIKRYIECDAYVIEAWSQGLFKQRYTTLTPDPDINTWIKTMQMQY